MSILTPNNALDVYHEETTSGKTTWESSPSIIAIECYLEPISFEMSQMYGLSSAYTLFKAFTNLADIVRKDKLIDKQGEEYVVHGVQRYEYNTDVESHLEVIVYKNDV